MGIVVQSPVRVCNDWPKRLRTPPQKNGELSMRQCLDSYGYAPGNIKYRKEDADPLSFMRQAIGCYYSVSDADCKKLEWLDTGKQLVSGMRVENPKVLKYSLEIVEKLAACVKDVQHIDLVQVLGQNTGVESEKSLEMSQELIRLVYDPNCAVQKFKSAHLFGKQAAFGSSWFPKGRPSRMLEDSSNTSANFSHRGTVVTDKHAVRVENNKLQVIASGAPRMRAPAGASHVVFKSLRSGIACMLLPDDTWTNHDGTGAGKFRAESLYVVAIWNVHEKAPVGGDSSNFHYSFRYNVGQVASTEVNKDPKVTCGSGLHFFLSMEEANKYYHKVDADHLHQVQAYFEQMLAAVPTDWNKRAAAVAAEQPPVYQEQKRVQDVCVVEQPPAYQEHKQVRDVRDAQQTVADAAQARDVYAAQLRSFAVRFRYSKRTFQTHCELVREMLDASETERARAITERIDRIPVDSLESVAEASAAFRDADAFRAITVQKYIDLDLGANERGSSMYFFCC